MAEPLEPRNPRVVAAAKLHRSAQRRKTGSFLAEGANAVTAALETGRVRELFYSASAAGREHELVAGAAASGVRTTLVSERAAQQLGETVTAPGLVAVCDLLDVPLHELLARAGRGPGFDAVLRPGTEPGPGGGRRSDADRVPDAGRASREAAASVASGIPPALFAEAASGLPPALFAVPVEIAEPGNAGTLIRVADAVGVDGVLLAGDTVDPHNGKCVRASAGSLFHVPVARERDIIAALDALTAAGVALLATTARGELDLDDADPVLAGPVAWLFGNEAHGLAPELAERADHRVRIPIRGRAESLNLAAAAAICLYASSRVSRAR
ncbi:TrmH family RNA methyltransferase [Nocardia harenae]|uniref:TrmH family RNA methyltransferase n=1 Tax=Nocardia harenae TaxID=358707 RepID=UPI000AE73FE2|nr:RNA methyltransferase [Nocardia harenae]